MSTQAERDQLYDQRKDHCPRLVSDGDSWFDYPIHANLIDWLTTRSRYAILRFEESGDTLAQIAGAARYRSALLREKPRALLISGGGNDLARDWWLKGLFRDPGASSKVDDALDTAEWDSRRASLRQGYVDILDSAGDLPVLAHGYDYFVPLNSPVKLAGVPLTGPWFFPAMRAAGIQDPPMQQAVARRLVDDFNQVLIDLVDAAKPRFHHIELRGTLRPGDWVNEIHPTAKGFRMLADRYWPQLKTIVGA